ncbi:MAG: hypothetical protein ACT4TC_04995, partial [Myxococcaceae bacterium]
LVAGRYYSVLGHELGHFFGLNHDYVVEDNLMKGSNTNRLLPRQCEIARSFLGRKLKVDLKDGNGRSCRAELAQRICSVKGTGSAAQTRCGQGSGYAERILHIYDEYPEALKRELCELSRVSVVENAPYSGETAPDQSGTYEIRLNADAIDRFWTVRDFLTWKEQLSFGGNPARGSPADETLPLLDGRMLQGSNVGLYFLFTHEVGHVFALRRGLSQEWSKLSWQPNSSKPLQENDFPYRDRMCFSFCAGRFVPKEAIASVYTGLFGTNFVSAYGALDSEEDFAETFVYYVLDRYKGATFSLMLPSGGASHDLMAHFHSERLASKRAFLGALFPR